MIQRASGIFLAKMARKKSSSITPRSSNYTKKTGQSQIQPQERTGNYYIYVTYLLLLKHLRKFTNSTPLLLSPGIFTTYLF